jgi:hypothetical protein
MLWPVFARLRVRRRQGRPQVAGHAIYATPGGRSYAFLGSEERNGNVVPGGYLNRIVQYAGSAEALDGANGTSREHARQCSGTVQANL